MIIRNEQLQAMAEARVSGFAQIETSRLRQVFPDRLADMTEPKFPTWVEERLKEGKGYGFVEETESEAFLDLCVCHEEMASESRPAWINDLLPHPGIAPQTKISILQHRLMFSEETTK